MQVCYIFKKASKNVEPFTEIPPLPYTQYTVKELENHIVNSSDPLHNIDGKSEFVALEIIRDFIFQHFSNKWKSVNK